MYLMNWMQNCRLIEVIGMIVNRNGKDIDVEIFLPGDRIDCAREPEAHHYELLVKTCRDLAYFGYKYRQTEPMVLTIDETPIYLQEKLKEIEGEGL